MYLDGDTYLCADCSELFELLHRFDLALPHDPWRLGLYVPDVPNSFYCVGACVMLLKRNQVIKESIEKWIELYTSFFSNEKRKTCRNIGGQPLEYIGDQDIFRKTIFDNKNLNFYILPPEYNFVLHAPGFAGVMGEIKILHTHRVFSMKQVCELSERLNKNKDIYRIYCPSLSYFIYKKYSLIPLSEKANRFIQTIFTIITKLKFVFYLLVNKAKKPGT